MSYCIITVIYGLPYTSKLEALLKVNEELEGQLHDEDTYGPEAFQFLYTGSPEGTGFIGIELGETDVCIETLLLTQPKDGFPGLHATEVNGKTTSFCLTPTPEQEASARSIIKRFAEKHPDAYDALKHNPIGVYFIFNYS